MAKAPFRDGGELGGLGEHVGDPRRYVTGPSAESMVGSKPRQDGPPERQLGPGPTSTRPVIEDERKQLQYIRSLTAPDDHSVMSPIQLGVAATRLDSGMKNRTSILIANRSDQVVWVNFHSQQVGVNRGIPLAANAPAGAFNGGTLSMDVSEGVQFFGVAAAGAANLVVVIESAR